MSEPEGAVTENLQSEVNSFVKVKFWHDWMQPISEVLQSLNLQSCQLRRIINKAVVTKGPVIN